MRTIEIFTDGSVVEKNNIIKAGMGIVITELDCNNENQILFNIACPYNGALKATSTIVEAYAIATALKHFYDYVKALDELSSEEFKILIYTDSMTIVDIFNIHLFRWQQNAIDGVWYKSNRVAVATQTIISQILEYGKLFNTEIQFRYNAAHDGRQYNEMADTLARMITMSENYKK